MTKLINHYLINDSWYLVDLPGYGCVRVTPRVRVVARGPVPAPVGRADLGRRLPAAASCARCR